MSSPATVSEYGKFIDLQNFLGSSPAKSGSIYLSGSDASEKIHTNVGISSAGSVTAVGSFIIGSADMSEADLEKLDGITNGTVAANKAVVVDANKDASGFRHVTATGAVTAGTSFVIGSADMSEADLEKLDGITNGTVAASKAVVVDSNKDADGFRNVTMTGDMTAGTITMTGFTVDADGDTALKSLLVDDSSTIGCDSDTDLMSLADGALTVNGTLSADTSFTLDAVSVNATELGFIDGVTAGTVAASKAVVVDSNKDAASFRNLTATGAVTAGSFVIGSADINEAELETIDGVTPGTAAASKALVLDASLNIGTINRLTASHAKIGTLDVDTINSVTTTATDLEVSDRRIVSALSASSANADGGGLRIGGGANSVGHASMLYDHANTALDFNIGGTTQIRLADGVLRPETDNDVDLGASGAEYKDLYLDGVAYIDDLRADQLGAALDANSQAITNINVDSGVIDNTVIGGNTAAAGTFTTLVAGGNVDLGDATSDTITATGRFDSDLVPSTDSARALGTSALQWSALHVDVGHIDQLGSALDGNSQNVTGIGTFSAAGATVTSLNVSDGAITNVSRISLDAIAADATDIDLLLTDNSATALEIKEDTNVYMSFSTANGEEGIVVKKEMELEEGGLIFDNKELQFATDESGAGASGSLKYVSADDVFQISGSGANGLSFSGSANFNGYGIEAGQASFQATSVTSLSVNDGNITNVGTLACDNILVDDAAVGLNVVFGGNTGLNKLSLTDNLASALDITQGANSYLKFVTTDGNEGIEFSKEAEFKQGGIVLDDQAMVFGDDDDGSIAFISAANVVRFDGGSAGLHFNDTSAFGADAGGKDVSFHGGAANELMKYTAADHTLKFVNASSATILTLGGDATSEFAVDVADGSNNQNKIRAAAFVTYSDERLKTDVAPMQNGLETINNLKAVNFTWKKDGVRDFGFMAQELKQVVPQAVHGTEEGLLGVDYGRLSAILVSAIQEQSAQIASLKKQLENK